MVCKTPRFEIYRDKRLEWRWRFLAANGRKVADSAEGYNRRRDCYRGIELINSPGPGFLLIWPVVDLTV